ncbi:MAG: tetratricopeptide repeat protein [Cyanobacteria bacterium SBLK]|nr:tetratricopeptide repeat protein [Cyanobacteria bacterium SBLK]
MWNPFKKRPPQPQEPEKPNYRALFEEVTEKVKGGATREEIEAWMQSRGVDESGLVQWLAGYVGKVRRKSQEGEVLAALQGLSEAGRGELGRMAREFAAYLQGSERSEIEEVKEVSNLSEVHEFNELMSQMGTSQSVLPSFQESLSYQEWFDRGIQLGNLGRFEEALTCFDQALQFQPDKYEAWLSQGFALFNLGRFEEALTCFDQALQFQPDYHEAWVNRGNALFNLGRLEEAIASYDRALQFQPDYHEAWVNRGLALFNLGRLEEAIASYDRALHFKLDYHEAWNNRGSALGTLGRLEEAIASYDRALHFKPDKYEAWTNRGLVLFNLGRSEEAIASYDRALHFKLDYHEAWFNQGNALKDLGRLEEAIASYDRALHFKPDFHEVWNNRGLALKNLGRLEEAIASYDRALQFKPDFHETWNNRGIVLGKLGKPEEAIASYDQALQFKPDDHKAWASRGIVAAKSSQHDRQFQRNFLFYFQATHVGTLHATSLQNRPQPRQNTLSPEVARYIQQTAEKHFCIEHAELNKRGYEGQLNSLQFPLNQNLICQDTHPKGWGFIHHRIGQTHYFQGRTVSHSRPYWRKAENSYKTALKTLTATDYPELHLEVLQDLSNVLLSLKEPEEARVLLQDGTDRLNRMLQEFKGGDYAKQQLARKFTAFNQLTVSLALQSDTLHEALTLAETGKNTCLRWIWNYGDIPELTYDQIRQLLTTPTTALIYWHLSPISLSTFLLLPHDPDPLLIPPPPQPEDERDPSLLQLLAFEAWVKKWNEDYAKYGTKKEDDTSETETQWYADLETQLDELKTLLNIAEIEQHLQTHAINHLILIPHRDLHRFPLPTFFEKQTCTTLPSAYLGLPPLSPNWEKGQNLLIVEHPQSTLKIGNKTQSFDTLYDAQVECELILTQFSPLTKGGWGGCQRLNQENTRKECVTEALKHPHDIFHFCGHAAYNPQNPALSCLYLNEKDTLTLQDVLALDLQAYRLIVLSACETAVTGNQTITDEYVGLVSGFLQAGASYVLSTLWKVESFPTTLLIVTFYQNLHSGQPPATALKNAQFWLRNATKSDLQQWLDNAIAALSHIPQVQFILQEDIDLDEKIAKIKRDRPYSHPYYWSSFIISGK